ncbi:integrase [Streptomyces noursei]|uniref:integrase n=1 Tax=Streptomyces noursei TaxID=1971 RepID=UPI0023B8024A|nr:integrase [Streptomyces noursei]
MPYIEWRGNKCRVKWWAGEYLPNGQKKYEAKSGFDDEAEALDYGLDREYEVRHGTAIKQRDGKVLMEKYCWDWYDAQELRQSTLNSYKSIIKVRILPYWSGRRVGEITTWEFEAWRKGLNAAAGRGEIAKGYVGEILMVFGMLMDDAAMKYKMRNGSPVIRQKGRGMYTRPPREVKRPMEMEVLHRLARNAYTVWGYTGWAYIWTAAFTAMRPGEMYGLQRLYASPNWPAAEPNADRRVESLKRYEGMPALRVQHQLQWVDGEKALTGPKYDSHRTLVVPPFLHEMHVALLASHASPWMFPALKGGDLLGTEFERHYWHPIRDGAEERTSRRHKLRPAIPAVEEMARKRIYLLRHGHKEWLDEDGHSEIASESRMGHEVAGVKGLYSNVTPGMELRVVETLQDRWEKFWQSGPWWMPPVPTPLPVDQRVVKFPQVRCHIENHAS